MRNRKESREWWLLSPLAAVLAATAAYYSLTMESRVVDLPEAGENLGVGMESGTVVVEPDGVVYFHPHGGVLRFDRGKNFISVWGVWQPLVTKTIPVESLGEEEIGFVPEIDCWRYFQISNFSSREPAPCGIEYVSIEPAGEGRVQVEVHYDQAGVFWRLFRFAGKAREAAGDIWEKLAEAIMTDIS